MLDTLLLRVRALGAFLPSTMPSTRSTAASGGTIIVSLSAAFLIGVRACPLHVCDIDLDKLHVLTSSFSPRYCFTSAASAAEMCPAVDILTASPSCHEASRASATLEPEVVEEALLEYSRCIVAAIALRQCAGCAHLVSESGTASI